MCQECEKIIILTGPTATGKTALAVELARRFDGEVVSADSRQVYRGLDLGSGKDLAEYGAVPFHLIDVVEPDDNYHLARFLDEARQAIAAIRGRGRLPIVAGGSALYLDGLLRGYELAKLEPDPAERERRSLLTTAELTAELHRYPAAAAAFHDWENPNRIRRALELAAAGVINRRAAAPRYDALTLGVYFPRAEVHQRIAARLAARFDAGMIDEVRRLHDERGVSWARLEAFGLEYGAIARYLQGGIGLEAMKLDLLARIRQFAKRQDIWFRKLEREGVVIHWLAADRSARAARLVDDFLADRPLPSPELTMVQTCYGPRRPNGASAR